MTRPTILDLDVVVVPKEPTREMWTASGDAVIKLGHVHHDKLSDAVFTSILSASPYQTAWDDVRKYVEGLERERKEAAAEIERLRKELEEVQEEANELVVRQYEVSAKTAEIERLTQELSEARSNARAEAYAIRLKKNRSGCACHINEDDEIVSLCQLHKGLIEEARATGRREWLEEMIGALSDDALAKRAADFLLERDQQTTQDERDDGERETSAFIILQMGSAAIRAAMEKAE